jgi:hypothetical protein
MVLFEGRIGGMVGKCSLYMLYKSYRVRRTIFSCIMFTTVPIDVIYVVLSQTYYIQLRKVHDCNSGCCICCIVRITIFSYVMFMTVTVNAAYVV